jgi:hypothetical protein
MLPRKPTKIAPLATLVVAVMLSILLASCSDRRSQTDEILIGLTNNAIPLLIEPKQPDPLNTGISSLDTLNRKWQVQNMVPLFPDVSPDDEAAVRSGLAGIYKLIVPKGTDLKAMIEDYETDPNIAYAELNQPVEVK